jgi:thioredoxin 1
MAHLAIRDAADTGGDNFMMKYLHAMLLTIIFAITLIAFCDKGVFAASPVEEALKQARLQGKVVMLELGSVGCIPCEEMRPVMATLSTTYKGKLEVIFVDVRKDNDTARRFRVFGIPTQVFLDKSGAEFHRHVGFYPFKDIVPVLKKAGI